MITPTFMNSSKFAVNFQYAPPLPSVVTKWLATQANLYFQRRQGRVHRTTIKLKCFTNFLHIS